MKKVLIISIHDIGNNFGSTLQACALCEFINVIGYEAKIINYKPKYAYNKGKFAQYVKSILFYKDVKLQKKRFRNYFNEHVKLTKIYKKYSQLKKVEKADIFVVGSDQVWNEFYDAGRDDAYYLKFTDCSNKMSYASSLGQLHSDEELCRLSQKLKGFSYISVREKESVKQLKSIGLNNVKYVLDPVFLFPREYYVDENCENIYGAYLFVYNVHYDEFMDKISSKIAKKLHLKIVLLGGYIQKYKCDIYLKSAGPHEFLNLINNAKFILTNSFHATAFSIILNKQFAIIAPYYSSLRIEDILNNLNIKNKIIKKGEDIDLALKRINYIEVNVKKDKLVKKSKEYLINSLSSFK